MISTSPDAVPPPAAPAAPAAPVDAPEPTGAAARLVRRWPELLVTVVAGAMTITNLARNGWGNTYYAAAVRSMTRSWSNFFFGAFDPGGWITVDKPPLALWLQAASARLFGYSSWSILLPSALCGTAAVWLLMSAVRRLSGRPAGVAAGVVLTLTPVAVAVARSNNPDATLVLCVVAAGYAVSRAVTSERHGGRWMALAGVCIGLGFLAKLLAAAIVAPTLWLAYAAGARIAWRRLLTHLAVGAAAAIAVGAAWVAVVDLTPLSSRPYIGGSTDGTAADLVFGYNGLGRVTGANESGPGGRSGPAGGIAPGGNRFPGGGAPGRSGNPAIDQFGGETGIGRLFNNGMGDQVMWLAPIAGTALVTGLVAAVRRRRRDHRLAGLVLFGGWALVTYVVFAFASGIFHNYYVSLLAPAVAALAGIGVAQTLAAGRRGRVVAGVALAATTALALVLMARVDAVTWLRPVVAAAGVAAVGATVLVPSHDGRGRARRPVLVAGAALAAVLVAPAAWSLSALGRTGNGTFPDARPGAAAAMSGAPGDGAGPAGPGGLDRGLPASLLSWLRTQRTTERWLVAVSSSMEASSAIIGGDSVMAMGGFSGSDPAMTPARLAELVRSGQLRFVLAGGIGLPGPGSIAGGRRGPGGGPPPAAGAGAPPRPGGAGSSGGRGGAGSSGGRGGATITSVVTRACVTVDPATYEGVTGGRLDQLGPIGGGLYDCQGKADAITAAGIA